MSSRILTYSVASIDTFMHDPLRILNKAEDGTIAIFANNTPLFYAITETRLAQLLNLEIRLNKSTGNIVLDTQLFKESNDTFLPMRKFPMYSSWQPDVDFLHQAALWGIALIQPVAPEELAAFISWWQAEGKTFTHIQWQQKLARSLQIYRTSNSNIQQKRNINTFSQLDTQIPHGFRGANEKRR